jgi:hypothetical protein
VRRRRPPVRARRQLLLERRELQARGGPTDRDEPLDLAEVELVSGVHARPDHAVDESGLPSDQLLVAQRAGPTDRLPTARARGHGHARAAD